MLAKASLSPPTGSMVLTGVFIRVLLREQPKRTRKAIIARMDEVMRDLIGSPARVVRVVEPSEVFDDARLEAVAYWKAIRAVVEHE